MNRAVPAGLAVLLCAALAACHADPPAPVPLEERVAALTDAERALLPAGQPTTARFGLDDPVSLTPESAGAAADAVRRLVLRPKAEAGGEVRFVESPRGRAARFPARCPGDGPACPRAILEADDASQLNPDARPVRYGARLRMAPTDVADGANVLQKGFSTGPGAQYKVQVDGAQGRPSCVVAVDGKIHKLESPVAVVDANWHTVACTAADGHLLINVDGLVTEKTVPRDLLLRSDQPLRVGGKHAAAGNDQFAGEIDEVFVSIYG
ncbi:hypothetical protein GCM10010124_29710 [Pilimelia terevasa]|uniref:Concanavalin A-like lectin/glucanase superfamily protein n=1 Tax=Pilimelia terevasa TaxID=53372 RepID=A0A8J3BTP3_9ACTN|nr:LamG-like jellyroll fold domain-containing protein [Pilimelia terevasa]GGK35090.1 hypothetical protein GCM10010124_29710 [Pilimelia terevasa]